MALARKNDLSSVNPLIVLLTDFGYEDSFVGVMKGSISKINPEARVIDLNHGIPPQNVARAAFELLTSASFFPSQTLFVCVVDPGVGSKREILFAGTQNHFFLAPDNGLLSWIFEKEKPLKIVSVENKKYFLRPISCTFQGRDIFAPVAAHWSKGVKMENFGPQIKSFQKIPLPQTRFAGAGKMLGEVIAVDRFGNLVSNFPNAMVQNCLRRRVTLQIKKTKIKGVSESYSSTPAVNYSIVEGSHGFLEVALRQGSAASKLKASEGEPLILFHS